MRTKLNEPIRKTGLRHYRPMVWTPKEVADHVTGKGGTEPTTSSSDGVGGYVAARPMSAFTTLRSRLGLAIAVFRGQADVLQWEQGQ